MTPQEFAANRTLAGGLDDRVAELLQRTTETLALRTLFRAGATA